MANHVSHASLPFPIKGARFTIGIPFIDSNGTPTDPTTPDTEVSQDGGTFADATEEVTTIAGTNGEGYVTLTGAEMNNSLVGVAFKVASGPKATLMFLYPRTLPAIFSGTASAGAAGSITGPVATSPSYDITGCIVKTTGGTGGGGTGGANNQARVITGYNTSTKAMTVTPNFETAPDATTAFDILDPTSDGAFKPSKNPLWEGTLSAIANGTVTLPANNNVSHEANVFIQLRSGTAATGKGRYLIYSGSGEVWNVDPAWNSDSETLPSGTITAELWPAPKIPVTNISQVNLTQWRGTQPNVLASSRVDASVGAYPGNSVQTGDVFARVGAPAGASLAVDVAAVKTDSGNLINRLGAFTGSGVNTALGFLKALFRKDLAAPSDVGGAFDPATDSNEAITDRLGAPAGASHAADIAAVNAKTTNLPATPAATGDAMALTVSERAATADKLLNRHQLGGSDASAGSRVKDALASGLMSVVISGATMTVKNADGTTAYTRTITRATADAIISMV